MHKIQKTSLKEPQKTILRHKYNTKKAIETASFSTKPTTSIGEPTSKHEEEFKEESKKT